MSETSTINIQGMSCQHCVQAVNQAVNGISGVFDVQVDLAGGSATVTFDAQETSLDDIKAAIADEGFEVL
ncbi:MAG: copper ion binding protein [Coriobacteriales bacterium]|jgi:copper chaperone|nr:copper ion binding protein [Coriobacteriales bacterium]